MPEHSNLDYNQFSTQVEIMYTKHFINAILLSAVCVMCGCISPTPGGGPLRFTCFDSKQSDRDWIMNQYYDPHRYTYHQTCWREVDFQPCGAQEVEYSDKDLLPPTETVTPTSPTEAVTPASAGLIEPLPEIDEVRAAFAAPYLP